MNETESELQDEQFILSLSWDASILAAVCYNLETFELIIMNEIKDFQPDHIQLRNIFRQIQPAFLIASGSTVFLKELIELLDLPDDTDINKYKANKNRVANADTNNICFYPFNRKSQLDVYRRNVYELNLPGLPAEASKGDRKLFVDSAFSMDQELVVIAMGNLIKYLQDNHLKFKNSFLSLDRNPIITNIAMVPSEIVLMDDSSFNSLEIFSNVYHPSSFKCQVRKEGLSLFNMLNECASTMGTQELKAMLKQPTRSEKELLLRLNTVDWCTKKENFDHVVRMRTDLSGILNISSIVGRIVMSFGKASDWRSLKKTVYAAEIICQTAASFSPESIKSTLLEELAACKKNDTFIKSILFMLDKTVDLEGIEEKKRFVTREGLDKSLDDKREALLEMKATAMSLPPDDVLARICSDPEAFSFVFFPEMGFVVGSDRKPEEMSLELVQNCVGVELVLQTSDAIYFRTPKCKFLNDDYEKRSSDIIQHELRIFNHLVSFLNEHLSELIDITKLCAKLDVLIVFASIAVTNNYTRPKITRNKELKIVNGYHPLVARIAKCVPSTTTVDGKLVTIITAPNASGKSIYIKQVALICFMAHLGMFVPAQESTIPLLDSIYTRIFTPESVYHSESAFMADLQQMSKVVMHSSDRSLVLIDEFGKGTHFKDGVALLAASIEHFMSRGDLSPIAFIITHFNQVLDIIRPRDMVNLKTIVTRKNPEGIFQSTFEIMDGLNNQSFSTEFPEGINIMNHITNQREKDYRLKNFTDNYNIAIKAFIILLAKMMLKRQNQEQPVSFKFISGMYTKVDIDEFIN